MDLNDRTFIVIGAAGRLGVEIVNSALRAGANIIAVDRSADLLQNLKSEHLDNSRFVALVGNMTDSDSVRSVIATGVENFGAVHGAVNTAYPRNAKYGRDFLDVTYEDFCENVSMHLGGYFLFMQQCAIYSEKADAAFSLVNMSSIYGVISPRFEVYAGTTMTMPVEYAAIKSALQHLVSYVTSYMKGTAFRVNCVSPGGILAGQDREFLDRYNRFCGSKGMLDAEDVVGTVLFLLSDASRYISGQNIVVDDGFSC